MTEPAKYPVGLVRLFGAGLALMVAGGVTLCSGEEIAGP